MILASEFEMRPLMAHCHRGLGRLYRETGDAEHLTPAKTLHARWLTYSLEKLEKG